jgi:hypothetical protein
MKAVTIPALVAAFVLTVACSEDDPPVPGQACIVNSDCKNPLSCSFMKCHEACGASGDCPQPGQICVRAKELPDGGFAAGTAEAELKVCLLVTENCEGYNSKCFSPLVCGKDLKCRAECLGKADCPAPQECVLGGQKGEKVCAEPSAIENGMLRPADGGAPADAAGGSGDSPPDAGAGGDGSAGDAPAGDAPLDLPPVGVSDASGDVPGDGPPAMVITHPMSEDIKDATSWTAGEHILKGMVRVEAPLTIACGSKIHVEFNTTVTILPGGSVITNCDAEHPIVFTSNRTSPTPGDWGGLTLAAGSNQTTLKYVQVEYAKVGVSIANLASAALDHVTVRRTSGAGVSAAFGATIGQFDGVVIEDAGAFALDVGSDVVGQLRPFTATPPKPVQVTPRLSNIGESAVWLDLGVPYVLGGAATIALTGAVTLSPGVELQLPPGARLNVGSGGSLKALGTPDQKVLITSSKPTRGPGDWQWILFDGGAATDNAFENTIIEYGGGGAGDAYALDLEANAQVAFTNVTIRKSAAGGLILRPGARLAKLTGVGFADVAAYPIALASNNMTKLEPFTSTGAVSNFVKVVTTEVVTVPGSWRNVGIPYEVNGALKVNARIEIEAGTELRFRPAAYLQLENAGSVRALGTETANVVLRSGKEPPAPGDWQGVYVYQSAGNDSLLRWTQIRHAGGSTAGKAGLTVQAGASIALENTTLAENLMCDVLGPVTATASTFTPCP